MTQEQFTVSATPQVNITKCDGDLVIRSWADTAVLIQGDDYEALEVENGLTITSRSDLKMTVPHETSLAIEQASGDFVLKNVIGDISLQKIDGDAVLVGVGNLKIGQINSDLSAKNLQANLSADDIRGDAILRNVNNITLKNTGGDLSARFVNGDIHLSNVGGDIDLRTVNGDVTVEKGERDVNLRNLGGKNHVSVAGDVRLRGSLTPQEHHFASEGDIVVRWPKNEPINFAATASTINNRLKLDKEQQDGDTLIGRIGDGDSQVVLKANGRIQLKETNIVDPKWDDSGDNEDMDDSFSFGFENIGAEIGRQINEHMSRFGEQFETKFGPDFATKISEKVSQKAEQAAAKAEKAAERAQRHAEREAQRASRHTAYSTASTPAEPAPKARKASKEEQLKILSMVEKGIISPDEATTLLDALEK